VSFYEQVTPRIDFQANASFGVYGGPNNESRATFPLTESPGLQLKLEDSVTRTDDFIVSAGADYTGVTTYVGPQPGFVPGPRTPIDVAPASPEYSVRGYVEARVRHRWTRRSSTELALGGVLAYQEEQLDVTRAAVTSLTTPYPMAEMITVVGGSPNPPPPQATTAARSELFVVARAQPWIDIFDGTVVERGEGILGWIGITGQNTFRAEVVGQYVIPTDSSPGRYRFLYGELDYLRSLGQSLSVDFGVRGGAETTSESAAGTCATTTSACASPTAIPAVSQSIYEGELIVGFSWKPNAVKL
jgi:hypothetical protein